MSSTAKDFHDVRVWGAVASLIVVLALDLLLPSVVLLPFVALPVLAVATIAATTTTVAVGVLGIVIGLIAGGVGQTLDKGEYWMREAALLIACAIAVYLAFTRNRTDRRLAESETYFRLLAENSANVVVWSRGHTIVWVSPSVEHMVGWKPSELIGSQAEDLIHSDDVAQGLPTDLGPNTGPESLRLRMRAKDGAYRWIEVQRAPFINERGEQDGSVVSFRTIDSEVAAEQELRRRATHDDLTGLLGRDEVIEQLEAIVRNRRRPRADCSVMFCDLDEFKLINDIHGHKAGDIVLRAIAMRLREAVRVEDVVARVGGDEFLVVLNGVHSLEEAMGMAKKVHVAVSREPIWVGDHAVTSSMSIGVTVVAAGEEADSIITRADTAMYQAKRSGPGNIVSISPPPGTLLGDVAPPANSGSLL